MMKFPLAALMFATSLPLLMQATRARADAMEPYFKTSCDPVNGVAEIDAKWAPAGEPQVGFPYATQNIATSASADDAMLPSATTPLSLVVCDLGQNREIAIRGVSHVAGPGQMGIWLYVGGRFLGRSISFAYVSKIIIRRMPEDYYVSISECRQHADCQNTVFTAPSFSCQKSTLPDEHAICSLNNLAALDVKLSLAYHAALNLSKVDKLALYRSQKLWVSRRNKSCVSDQIAKNVPTGETSESLQAKCLEKLYSERINMLERRGQIQN